MGFLLSSVQIRSRREPEHSLARVDMAHGEGSPRLCAPSGAQQGAARLWGRTWGGHPAFAGGVTGSPGTALCTPAAFQAKPPPTCCVNTAGAWRSHFSSTQLWREAQHLPLTMRLTHSQTPGSLRLLLGMLPAPWPPHSPVCPHHGSCCPPPAPTAWAEIKPVVGESTQLLAMGCLAWVLFSSDPSRIESLIVSYMAASGGDRAASCAGLCSPCKGVTRTKCGSCTGWDGCVAPSWLSVQSPRLTALLLQRR